ncbi:zinc ribbon domain-containing protein [Anaerolinea thermophila]|uniref:DZANK-type domain-containing protein n=1 Tax=Anaerolinea thermophila (strain DSM 14523 / JCM 11388 / NBRC 100420 / UNI-1) TaxID=926569 RepID=E8N4T5_ANATU|nr:hypothetical protein [Anaerolinea thermophila]BAJ63449.1 hypothetical protein ANT_14210 [Anaerolinea thermophila UNI-1]
MQTCSRCKTVVSDEVVVCPTCQADLRKESTTAIALRQMQENPRVYAIHVAVSADACPACMAVEGTYLKDQVPTLPVEGCSNPNGCKCTYQPLLTEIFP